ncbi:MAG: hypothetical protein IJ111_10170, partial [Eggerthellaceae bacterium]|nr:hypothetical protein [Eggerthellaceae bacterium]
GADYVGVVPHDVVPRYCESMFLGRYGAILDFIHVYGDDMESFGDEIEWLPTREARLVARDGGKGDGEDSPDAPRSDKRLPALG